MWVLIYWLVGTGVVGGSVGALQTSQAHFASQEQCEHAKHDMLNQDEIFGLRIQAVCEKEQ